METTRYQRKPQYVQAVRVTEDNFLDVANWCQGSLVTPGKTLSLGTLRDTEDKYIQVRVNNPMKPKHSRAYVGDWVLYSEYKGYQVYTQGAFKNAFDKAPENKSVEEAVAQARHMEEIKAAVAQARQVEELKAAANGRQPENIPDDNKVHGGMMAGDSQ